jgi:hypothetical protein
MKANYAFSGGKAPYRSAFFRDLYQAKFLLKFAARGILNAALKYELASESTFVLS